MNEQQTKEDGVKEKVYMALKWLAAFVRAHAMVLANVSAILVAYSLSKDPRWADERELLEQLCVALGITGTALVRSMLHKDPPAGAP